MKINFNMSAVITNDCLSKSENALSDSIEKLSSGYKINHAKDSPSGIAIAKRMNAQIRSMSKAAQNANDGISVIGVAEGTLSEVHDMLQRLNELSIKAANGPLSDGDRAIVQEEVDSLLEEIDRIADSTEYNGSILMDGTFDLKGYVEKSDKAGALQTTSAIKVEDYSDQARIGFYEVEIETYEDAYGQNHILSARINGTPPAGGTVATATLAVHGRTVPQQTVENQIFTIDEKMSTVTITADKSFSLTLDIDLDKLKAEGEAPGTGVVIVDLTGLGAMTMQIGANEGQTLDIRIPKVSCKTLAIENLDVSDKEEARLSIDRVASAINELSSIRSRLGAYENRLEHIVSSLDATEESMTAAYSRIIDVDMAEEMTEYTKNQVLSQAGTSMLAQANERPSQILQLLQ